MIFFAGFSLNIIYIVGRISAAAIAGDIILFSLGGLVGHYTRAYTVIFRGIISQKKQKVHSATCSCSIELYKQWYKLADFLPNWDISRGFLYTTLMSP